MKELINSLRLLSLIFTMALFVMPARADEGMWLLPYLEKTNAKDMKAKGLKLKVKDIYNADGVSLKDAIVIFGNGCTGEIVSPAGLLLTNHHCGYPNIQSVSTVEHDHLKNGFWAKSHEEEIPAPGLAVQFIRHIKDVTDEVLGDAAKMGVGPQFDSIIKANHTVAMEQYKAKYQDLDVVVMPFMGGNQYFMIAKEIFRDVRLVGTPPNSMGKFGGDTDNWMWPRHTDDFSMFRVYAAPDGKPAEYSPENKPLATSKFLKISTKGVKEKDFTMIMGFPGSTERYMTSFEMQQMVDVENTNRIFIRGERQAIIMEDMLADNAVRLQYSAKYAQSSNYWKNSMGMNAAIAANGVIADKQALEKRFAEWAAGTDTPDKYELALPKMKEAVEKTGEMNGIISYFNEALFGGVELVTFAVRASSMMKVEEGILTNKDAVAEFMATQYKNYNQTTDLRVAKRMFAIVRDNVPAEYHPSFYEDIASQHGGNIDAWVDKLYEGSIFASQEKFTAFLNNFNAETLAADPAMQIVSAVRAAVMMPMMSVSPYFKALGDWQRVYMKGLMAMSPDEKFYPDANFTIRLTYGQVLPYSPRDGVDYRYYTTMKGVIEKEDNSKPLEFTVPDELKQAYATSDYGVWGENGELRLNFLSNNDITGGNSGSPVLNAKGELIGLAFDGNWEALSSDVMFDAELQRCINLDVRYLLWTIDKFAGAGYLLDEMTIVNK